MTRRPPARHLVVWGFMGAGKSAAGRLAANALGRPFVDLDERIARAAGRTVAEIFAREGEAGFRVRETAALRAALAARRASVIAVGGGALLAPGNFRLAARNEPWLLEVSLAAARRRVAADGRAGRPLAGELAAKFRARRRAYARVRDRVPECASPEAAARALLLARGGDALPLDRGGLHPAAIGIGATRTTLETLLAGAAAPPVLVTHPALAAALPEGLRRRLRVIPVPEGERSKSGRALLGLWSRLAALRVDRATPVIGLGGGVIGDLAGFAAASYRRGVPFHLIPTTLTAMVDAALGGKTAIDLPDGKNLAGLFSPPASVTIDPAWLLTLPPRELAGGLAELVKTAALDGEVALAALERDLPAIVEGDIPALVPHLRRAAAYKLRLCARDPRERGERALLNLGHTIAHEIERRLGYERLTHGEAVAIGLVEEHRLAARLGVLPARAGRALAERLARALGIAGLPVSLREAGLRGDAKTWLDGAVTRDKKTVGGILKWPLLKAPGKPVIVDHAPRSRRRSKPR